MNCTSTWQHCTYEPLKNLITLDPFTSFVLKEAVNNHYTAIQLQTMFVNFIISILKSQINTKVVTQ